MTWAPAPEHFLSTLLPEAAVSFNVHGKLLTTLPGWQAPLILRLFTERKHQAILHLAHYSALAHPNVLNNYVEARDREDML